MAVDLGVASKEYFSNLNPLAKKISVDVESTREAYQDFWHSLSVKDQDQVIDESIINPSAVIKYAHLPTLITKDNPNVHSWFTKSQLDLFNQNPYNLEGSSAFSSNSETPNKLEQSKKRTSNQIFESNKNKETDSEKIITNKVQKPSVLKPKIPPPPPPSKNCILRTEIDVPEGTSMISSSTDIPKTGFDFLDNW